MVHVSLRTYIISLFFSVTCFLFLCRVLSADAVGITMRSCAPNRRVTTTRGSIFFYLSLSLYLDKSDPKILFQVQWTNSLITDFINTSKRVYYVVDEWRGMRLPWSDQIHTTLIQKQRNNQGTHTHLHTISNYIFLNGHTNTHTASRCVVQYYVDQMMAMVVVCLFRVRAICVMFVVFQGGGREHIDWDATFRIAMN